MVLYTLAAFRAKANDHDGAERAWTEPRPQVPTTAFRIGWKNCSFLKLPSLLDPNDARAPYYLGNLFYARRRHEDAIAVWERAAQLDPTFSIVVAQPRHCVFQY